MKAKIKENGKWITVDTCDEGFYDVETHEIYEPDELEFDSGFDWSAFRREAAKDILCTLMQCGIQDTWRIMCENAIDGADELVKQLKEK